MTRFTPIVLLLWILAAGGCTVLNQTDSEKKIREFISAFEKSLQGPDSEILNFFNSSQSPQSILAAVRVIQNLDSMNVKCVTYFDQAVIVHDTAGIKVLVHAEISVDTLEFRASDTTSIAFYLKPIKGKLAIHRMAAETFYDSYVRIKNQLSYALVQKEELEVYDHYFEAVKFLQETYDSVVWAMRYKGESYYYVVQGSWSREHTGTYEMGLVDKSGKIIIPVKFDLVCTPDIAMQGVVEVRKEGLTGYYRMNGQKMLEPEYDYIIPYDGDNIYALVKKGDEFGTVSIDNTVSLGTLSESEQAYIRKCSYLKDITFSGDAQYFCEVPSQDRVGIGIIMPPSYLVANKLFPEIMDDFAVNPDLYRANTASVNASYSFMESVLGKVSALVTVVEEQYLEGREGFYRHNKIDFMDENGSIVASSDNEVFGKMEFKQIDSTLLEIMTRRGSEMAMMYMGVPENESEMNIPNYYYYRIVEGGIPELQSSNRVFTFTEFVKLDDSYLSGEFNYYNHESQQFESRNYLRDSTLMDMRNEILASYGYIFPDENIAKHFTYFKWYAPRFQSVQELAESLSEVDKYNLEFLEKKLGPVEKEAM